MSLKPLAVALVVGAAATLACNALVPAPAATPTPLAPTRTPIALNTPVSNPPTAGPAVVRGTFDYTNDIIETYYAQHAVALVDMYGFVTRDDDWEIPVQAQVLGFLSLDASAQTGEYFVLLPAVPQGTAINAQGVQVFVTAYWPNVVGGPFAEGDDRITGWPSYLASTRHDPENKDEVVGGALIVWSPVAGAPFPVGWGEDGLLFTPDDAMGTVPAGYSVVNLESAPFTISQAPEPTLALYEPPDSAIKDYSDLNYAEAFEALYAKVSKEWAFNGIPGKEVDWQALYATVQPQVARARNGLEFYNALRQFAYGIPDGHVGLSGTYFLGTAFRETFGGSAGLGLKEAEDGTGIVTYVGADTPAGRAGIRRGAVVKAINGTPIAQAVAAVTPFFSPYSTEAARRYDQFIFVTRGRVGDAMQITYRNPGATRDETATVRLESEIDSYFETYTSAGSDDLALPVEFRVLEDEVGYIRLNSNYDDLQLLLRLFERALKTFAENDIDALVIDLRQNGGGAPLGLAGYLHDEEIFIGTPQYYSDKTGQFEVEDDERSVEPAQTTYQFRRVAVMVGLACASACEFEAYAFSQIPGVAVVGYYPSSGVYAEVSRGQFELPEGISMQVSTGRTLDAQGNILLEGVGVVPTVRVPRTPQNLLSADDPELQAAIREVLR